MANKIFDKDFLKKLDNIVLNTRMAMSKGSGGSRKSRSKGSSVEFSDFREYTIGDDFRRIDWNAYGRFDKLFVKLFMEEREAVVNIFIDCSGSMEFGNPKKSVYASKLAGVLAYLALNNLDRVSLNSVYEKSIIELPVVIGRTRFDRCMSFLEKLEFTGTTDLSNVIRKKSIRAKGISVIISDFFTNGGIEEAVKYLVYNKQDVILINILSPQEIKPTLDGQIRLVDSESKEAFNIAVTPAILKQYEKTLDSFTSNMKKFCSKMGVAYMQLGTDEAIEKVVFEDMVKTGIIR